MICSLPILVMSHFKSGLFCTISLTNGVRVIEVGRSYFSCISAESLNLPFFLFCHHCFISKGYHSYSIYLVLAKAVSLWVSTSIPAHFKPLLYGQCCELSNHTCIAYSALSINVRFSPSRVTLWSIQVSYIPWLFFLRFPAPTLYIQAYSTRNSTEMWLLYLKLIQRSL